MALGPVEARIGQIGKVVVDLGQGSGSIGGPLTSSSESTLVFDLPPTAATCMWMRLPLPPIDARTKVAVWRSRRAAGEHTPERRRHQRRRRF